MNHSVVAANKLMRSGSEVCRMNACSPISCHLPLSSGGFGDSGLPLASTWPAFCSVVAVWYFFIATPFGQSEAL